MSKVVHPKPVWSWSVALLSTLLLSPVAGTAAWQAFAHACGASLAGRPAAPSPAAGGENRPVPAAPGAPRRADDEWALRLRAQDDRPPHAPRDARTDLSAAFLFVRARTVLFVPDEHDTHAPRAAANGSLPPAPARTARSPRAPPVLVSSAA